MDYGDSSVRVIIDPIDGSLNAKRGVSHFALSVGVADGPTMGDMAFGFVHDFGASEQWWAWRGQGAWLNGDQLDPTLPERRWRDGKLELLGIESADPRWVADSIEPLVAKRPPAARPGHDRRVAVHGGGGPVRRDGHAAALARGRCRRRPADRARSRRCGQLHRLRAPARCAAGRDAELAPGGRAQRRDGRRACRHPGMIDWILAQKIAVYVAGKSDAAAPKTDLEPLAVEAEKRVIGLHRPDPDAAAAPARGDRARRMDRHQHQGDAGPARPGVGAGRRRPGAAAPGRPAGHGPGGDLRGGGGARLPGPAGARPVRAGAARRGRGHQPSAPAVRDAQPRLGSADVRRPGEGVHDVGDAARGDPRGPVRRRAVAARPCGRAGQAAAQERRAADRLRAQAAHSQWPPSSAGSAPHCATAI